MSRYYPLRRVNAMPLQVAPEVLRGIIAAYLGGSTILEIAMEFGYSTTTVRKYLVRHDVPRRPQVPRPGKHWTQARA